MPRFFTVEQVAEILHRHRRTIYRWLAEGFIRGKKVRDGWLIPEEELTRILREKWDTPEERMTFDDKRA